MARLSPSAQEARNRKLPQFEMTVKFRFDHPDLVGLKHYVTAFVKDALECWGGQRHPDDWLFDSLESVVVKNIHRVGVATTSVEDVSDEDS